jgi:hypothetical protein
MAAPEAARKTTVLEGMVEVVAGIVAARAMADPIPVVVDVRRVRMSLTVTERVVVTVRFRPAAKRAGTMVGDEPSTEHVARTAVRARYLAATRVAAPSAPLREHRDRTQTHHRDQHSVLLHIRLQKDFRH